MLVDIDIILSAGDAAPDCDLPCEVEMFDCVLAVDGRALGGRIECFLVGKPAAGRGKPAIRRGNRAPTVDVASSVATIMRLRIWSE